MQNPWVEVNTPIRAPTQSAERLTRPWELSPTLELGREHTTAILAGEVEQLYEQTHAIAQGWAEHPRASYKVSPLVPAFGMDADGFKAMVKENKKRDKAKAAQGWKEV